MVRKTVFLLTDNSTKPVGSIKIRTFPLRLTCIRETIGYGRPHKLQVLSSKRCPEAGSCSAGFCNNVKVNEVIHELGITNNWPGLSYCSESSGCFWSGCFHCSAACTFWRLYAEPISKADELSYEIFRCQWQESLPVQVEIMKSGNIHLLNFNLNTLESYKKAGIKASITSVSLPPLTSLQSTFVTNGKITSMLPKSVSPPSLRCKTLDDADYFTCALVKNPCSCKNGDSIVACDCPEDPYDVALRDRFKHLPIYSNLVWFDTEPGNMRAVTAKTIAGISELQISLKQFWITALIEHTFCNLQVHSLVGCYSCSTGANLRYTCTSTHGNVTGYATCESTSFSSELFTRGNRAGSEITL